MDPINCMNMYLYKRSEGHTEWNFNVLIPVVVILKAFLYEHKIHHNWTFLGVPILHE